MGGYSEVLAKITIFGKFLTIAIAMLSLHSKICYKSKVVGISQHGYFITINRHVMYSLISSVIVSCKVYCTCPTLEAHL